MRDQRPFISLLQDLGKQHLRYGVRDEDFETFAIVLLKLLNELLRSEFGEPLRNAWILVFAKITRIMRSGIDDTTAKISRATWMMQGM
jgi:hemoglobin-like flavoprotein